ncbi:hypothetical protein FXF51_06170 [Nonomuraea sp. PA05]|uniref:hypothetical protein n=1 Tax=Nonomuraea sp. PA05 TaxID=2604466 RepID=UPI0011D5C610|nr:hypothetical protein [Nonomuraea sp. PA05]TYB69746.1 hypothetical protein FXF51_06170 [Nonomuraea sp. PA05]
MKGDVKPFVAEMSKAALAASKFRDSLGKPLPVNLDAASAQAKILQLERDLAKLRDRRDPIRPDVDTAQAQASIAELQRRMADLSSRTIGVDLDAGAAKAEIAAIQRELEALNRSSADIDVRVDTMRALADLRTLEAQMTSVSSRSARVKVDADVGGALAGIAMVGAALAGLPAVTSIAVGVGALGGAFAAAGAGAAGFAAVAVPSLGRINEALQQQASAAGGAGGATKSAAQSAAEAASRALQLEQAERRVADAQKSVKAAQEDLTRARQDAKRALEDYAFSVKDAALAEEDAALSVEEAARRLAEVQADDKSTDLEIRRAELAHRQAMARLEEQQTRTKRLKEDKAEADRKGVEGSDQVRAAQDKLLKSQQDLVEAQKQLTVTQLQQKAAMEQAGGAAGGAASKFAELSKREQALAKDIKKFQDSYVAWQRSLQPDVFPVIRSGMDLMSTGMKLSTPLIKSSSKAFNELLKELNTELKSQEWKDFFDDLAETAPTAIDKLGNSAINVGNGLRGVFSAVLPESTELLGVVERLTQRFEDWGENLEGSPEFEEFLAYVRENGPKVAEIFGNLATFAGKLVDVGADLGPGVLDFMVVLSDRLANLEPGQIQAIATGIGLIFAAAKAGTTLKLGAFVLLAELLSDMSPGQIQALAVAIAAVVTAVKGFQAVTGAAEFFRGLSGSMDAAGKSADGAKGKLTNLAGLLGKGGVIAAAAAGTALAVDQVTDSLDGLNPSIDKVADGLADFGRGAAPTGELLDQLDPKLQSLVGRFETFGDSARRLASDNPFDELGRSLSGIIDDSFGVQLDGGRQAIDNLDQALVQLVQSGRPEEAAGAFNRLATQAQDAGVPVDKLRELFPQYAASLDGAIPQTDAMRDAMGLLKTEVDPTAVAMQAFNTSLDTFNAKTDVAQRTLELRDAFNEAKRAVEEAGGKLDLTAGMTDKQRQAVVKARDEFSGYITKVLEAARAAGELGGKTGEAALKSDEARDAFIRQLPQLFELAGKSSEAKAQIYNLAEGFGVNRAQADKAATGVKGVKDVIGELKSKKVDIGADVSGAMSALGTLGKNIAAFFSKTYTIQVRTELQEHGARASWQKNAKGAINRYAQGGIERYAAGGVRSMRPHLATRPTILYGEGADDEAFIPYEARYREEATALLGQVANDFGLSLNNEQAARGLAKLSVTIDDSGLVISDKLSGVMGSLEETMGQAGSLTSSINGVATTAEQLTATVGDTSAAVTDAVSSVATVTADSVTVMSTSVDALTVSVKDLMTALAEGKAGGGSGKSGSAKSSALNLLLEAAKGVTGKGGSVKGSTPVDMIAGDYGSGGYLRGDSALTYGSPANASRVSAPQQMSASSSTTYESPGATSGSGSGGSGSGSGGGPLVAMYGTTIHREADADVLVAQIGVRVDSRG